MQKRVIEKFLCCGAAYLCGNILFRGHFSPLRLLPAAILLTVFYLFIRPVFQAVILPLNLFLLGILTPITDGLLVFWAAGLGGNPFGYWQSVILALFLSLLSVCLNKSRKAQRTIFDS